MKVLGLLAIALVGVVAATPVEQKNAMPDPSWAKLVERTTTRKAANDDADPCNGSVYSCADCTTARVCKPSANGPFVLVQTVPCGGPRPFCDSRTGSCVEEQPDDCGAQDDFICLGEGKYPDSECNRFHRCANLESLTFECRIPGETYNALTQTCEPNTACGSFDCAGKKGAKVPHSEFPGYYAFCHDNNGPLVVDSCPGNYQMNVTSQICEPICHTEGVQADITDCHYYFKCTKVIVKRELTYMDRERRRCAQGEAFSSKDFMCIDESQVEDCKKQILLH